MSKFKTISKENSYYYDCPNCERKFISDNPQYAECPVCFRALLKVPQTKHDDVNARKFTVEVSLKDTDKFKEILNVIKGLIEDNRVPVEVRQELKEKMLSIIESKS